MGELIACDRQCGHCPITMSDIRAIGRGNGLASSTVLEALPCLGEHVNE